MKTLPQICKILQISNLFQGMSREELLCLVGQTKFEFLKFKEKTFIAKEGQQATHLLLLLNGIIEITSRADNKGYEFKEEINAPYTIQPQCLFGFNTRYTKFFMAKTTCNILAISKNETLKLTDEYIILKLNLLNILSTQAQKAQRRPWKYKPCILEKRIAYFIKERIIYPAGKKIIKTKMETLAKELNVGRRDVSKSLHQLQDKKLIIIKREKIIIPKVEDVIKDI